MLPVYLARDINPWGMRSIGEGLYVLISSYHWGKKKGDTVWIYLGAEMLRFIFSVIRLPCYPSRDPSQRKEWNAQGGLYFSQTFINQNKKLWMQNSNTITKSILNWGKATQTATFWGLKRKKSLPKIARDQNREGLWKEKKTIAWQDCFSKWFGIEIMYIAQIQPLRTRWIFRDWKRTYVR